MAHNKLEASPQDQRGQGGHGAIPLSAGMLLVTLGVVYGDIGTSPMYTMKSIVANNGGIGTVSEDMILGALSLVIWTMTLVTTVKYVVIAMKADNHNEGGIFALFSLVRKVAPWLILPAMIGGAALLADGILTPAVTVTTAIEGLRTIEWGHALLGDGQTNVIIITIIIICGLFAMQRAGTSSIGKLFGPLMTLWFLFLGRRRPVQHARQPVHLACAQPHPRHHVPVLAHQPLGHYGARLCLSVDDRRRGPLLGHGPRWQGKHLCILAVC